MSETKSLALPVKSHLPERALCSRHRIESMRKGETTKNVQHALARASARSMPVPIDLRRIANVLERLTCCGVAMPLLPSFFERILSHSQEQSHVKVAKNLARVVQQEAICQNVDYASIRGTIIAEKAFPPAGNLCFRYRQLGL